MFTTVVADDVVIVTEFDTDVLEDVEDVTTVLALLTAGISCLFAGVVCTSDRGPPSRGVGFNRGFEVCVITLFPEDCNAVDADVDTEANDVPT